MHQTVISCHAHCPVRFHSPAIFDLSSKKNWKWSIRVYTQIKEKLRERKKEKMASTTTLFICTFISLVLVNSKVLCYQHKVGDLSGWGVPASSNPNVYTKWVKYNNLKIGDSLFFLYPPTQDSVIQVTPQSYKSCNLKDPILYMNNGNSLFNITSATDLYFTSGEPGHCVKGQKLHISFFGNGSSEADAPSNGPSSSLSDTAAGPSYPNVFGAIPAASSASSMAVGFSGSLVFVIWALLF